MLNEPERAGVYKRSKYDPLKTGRYLPELGTYGITFLCK
jgi:hypothetical protein